MPVPDIEMVPMSSGTSVGSHHQTSTEPGVFGLTVPPEAIVAPESVQLDDPRWAAYRLRRTPDEASRRRSSDVASAFSHQSAVETDVFPPISYAVSQANPSERTPTWLQRQMHGLRTNFRSFTHARRKSETYEVKVRSCECC